jgi:hypothetical protein
MVMQELVQITRIEPTVVNVGGVEEYVFTEIVEPVTRETVVPLEAGNVQVFGPDGKRVDPAEMRKLLSRPAKVLLSADGKAIDPIHLQRQRDAIFSVVYKEPFQTPALMMPQALPPPWPILPQ